MPDEVIIVNHQTQIRIKTMSIDNATQTLIQICQEQQIHYTDALPWVQDQCKDSWKGLNPHEVIAGAREELSGTSWL